MEPISTFGEYLKECRTKDGISARRVEREAGISRIWLRNVERGANAPFLPKHWGTLISHIPTLKWDELALRLRYHHFLKLIGNAQTAATLTRFYDILQLESRDQRLRETLDLIGELG